MKVMILAAGRGERLRPLTDSLPKPLLEVRGKPLIVYHLERLRAAGFSEVVINIAWLAERIRTYLGDGSHYGLNIQYSHESGGALETGGGILHALPLLGGKPFLVVNADIYTDFPFQRLRTALRPGDLAHLVMVPNLPDYPQGDFCLSADGRMRADGETRFTYSGIGVHDPMFFDGCKPGRFPLLPLWRDAMQKELVSGEIYSGSWRDIGTIEALRAAS